MRRYQVWGGSDGGKLKVYDHGLRGTFLRLAEEGLDFLDGVVLHHALCGAGLPEFAWSIPMGKPKRDPADGMLNNSVGSFFYDSYNRLYFWLSDQCEQDLIAELPLNAEQSKALSVPFLFDEDNEES